jgi:NAD(P)-dependent dehydrogenase (short-subunit alcohol dehydrogenase family)
MKLKDKTAIITGGGTGIGRATALLFAREGASVVITGRTEKTLAEASDEAKRENFKIDYLVSDISKVEDCKDAIGYMIESFGRVDIVFNNAGVIYQAKTHETKTRDWDETFDVNVKGAYLMSKHAIPYMLENNYGCIVNNSSILGLKGSSGGFAAYCASKGAVNQLTRSMALEYADKGIRINAICPGTAYTPMVDGMFEVVGRGDKEAAEELYKSVHPIGRLAQPEEIAHAVLFLCDDNIAFMTGTMLSVDGGLSAK